MFVCYVNTRLRTNVVSLVTVYVRLQTKTRTVNPLAPELFF